MSGAAGAEPLATLDAHGRHAQAVLFAPDGRFLLSAAMDATVRFWSVPDFEPAGVLEGHRASVNSLALFPGGDRLVTASSDGAVRLWAFPQGDLLKELKGPRGAALSPQGNWLATVDRRARVQLWAAPFEAPPRPFPRREKRVFGLGFTPDEGALLLGGEGPIFVDRLQDGQPLAVLEGHRLAVAWLGWTPGGDRLVSTGAEGALRVWDPEGWRPVAEVALPAPSVYQVAIRPDGKEAFVSCNHAVARVDLEIGRVEGAMAVPVKGVYGLAVSPDGRLLANAAADGRVRVWRV